MKRALGRNLEGPGAAKRLIGIGDSCDESRRRRRFIDFHHHRAGAHVLTKANASARRGGQRRSADAEMPRQH
jgi:hypothetical protein